MKEIGRAYDKIVPKMAEPEEKGIDSQSGRFKVSVYCSGNRGNFQEG